MFRLLVGFAVGWLLAREYYRPVVGRSRSWRSISERARDTAAETREVAEQLAREARAAAIIEGDNLEDKAERIRRAATD